MSYFLAAWSEILPLLSLLDERLRFILEASIEALPMSVMQVLMLTTFRSEVRDVLESEELLWFSLISSMLSFTLKWYTLYSQAQRLKKSFRDHVRDTLLAGVGTNPLALMVDAAVEEGGTSFGTVSIKGVQILSHEFSQALIHRPAEDLRMIQSISIMDCDLSLKDATGLSRLFQQLPNLHHLNFSGNSLGPDDAKALAASLGSCPSPGFSLDISRNPSITVQGLADIVRSSAKLTKVNDFELPLDILKTGVEVDLSGRNLQVDDATIIAACISASSSLNSLK